MNVFVKIFLRVISVAVGTYYAYGGLYPPSIYRC
jgi:hypothetical protein